MKTTEAKKRLEELRQELRKEQISYGELAELQTLQEHIEPGDVELLEPAGVPEEFAYLPGNVRSILFTFDDDKDPYQECTRVESELDKIGYTAEWGLDGVIHDVKIKQKEQQTLSGVKPKFCFVCGSKLETQTLGWLQCESEDCGEMFLPYLDDEGNPCLVLKNTPFTPK